MSSILHLSTTHEEEITKVNGCKKNKSAMNNWMCPDFAVDSEERIADSR